MESTADRLERLMTEKSQLAQLGNPACPNCQARTQAEALRVSLALLGNGNGRQHTNGNGSHHAAHDIVRRKRRKPGPKPKTEQPTAEAAGEQPEKGRSMTAAVRKQRQKSAKLLATFDPVIPKLTHGRRSIGSLVRRGYLMKRDNGYIRTEKPYQV